MISSEDLNPYYKLIPALVAKSSFAWSPIYFILSNQIIWKALSQIHKFKSSKRNTNVPLSVVFEITKNTSELDNSIQVNIIKEQKRRRIKRQSLEEN